MKSVELSYQLLTQERPSRTLRNPLIETLAAIAETGSLTAAARRMGYSFRHVWNQVQDWEAQMGQALVRGEQGRRAQLTAFGEKLLWTERMAQARLAPQIEALRAELERTMALAFDPHSLVLPIYASHDDALPLLREFAAAQSQLHVDLHYCGSVDAIRALNEGRCEVAGFHVAEGAGPGSRLAQAYQPLLKPGVHKLIGFSWRAQGLMVAPGNPLSLQTLADVVRTQARFANRALGTGTRLLLDQALDDAGLAGSQLQGYDLALPSHASVAMAVRSGQADAGLGVESSARAAGLDFVPLMQETYYLVCLREALEHPAVQALRALLAHKTWRFHLFSLPGCAPHHSGDVQSLTSVLPWWSLRPKRGTRAAPNPL